MSGMDIQKAIGGVCTEIPQRQCGKEEIYVDIKKIADKDNASRRGGYKRRKDTDVKLIVTSVYTGEIPMKDMISNAIKDSFMRMKENKEITA
ncbi:MAG: hypothetical protein ILA13_00730 [Eubacterium sp.]|nr:hypothetical protein [Eubacterium sp.]